MAAEFVEDTETIEISGSGDMFAGVRGNEYGDPFSRGLDEVKKMSKGQADPKMTTQLLEQKLAQ